MNLSLQSKLTLASLTIRQDQKHYIVEDNRSGEFFEMPTICIDAIHRINQGQSLAQIEEDLTIDYPDEDVDMVDFASQLFELELIEKIDGEIIELKKAKRSPSGFTWISPRVGLFLFNKVTTKLYLAIICLNLVLFVSEPNLLPTYQDIFIFDSMMFNLLTYMGISLFLIIIHEFGHILAVRSHQLPASLEIGNRLFFVVFETDLSTAWKLAPKQRNILYLAGISFDQLMMLCALGLQLFLLEGNSVFVGILGIVVLDLFIKSIYQCCFYMKTDLYYLFENITGCYNLMENGKVFLNKWIPLIKKDLTTETYEDEKKIVRIYGFFYLSGIILTFSLFLFYFVPQLVYAYSQVLQELINPVGNPYFWDAVIFVGQTVLIGILLLYSWSKKRIHQKSK